MPKREAVATPKAVPQAAPIKEPAPVAGTPPGETEYEPTIEDAFGLAIEEATESAAAGSEEPAIPKEEPKAPPAEAKAKEAEPSAFSKIDPDTLPPEMRRIYDDLQRDHAMRTAEMQAKIDESKDMARYRDFISRLSQDQGLREHILAYDQRGGQPATARTEGPKADTFADLQPEERKVVGRVIRAAVENIKAELAPFVQQVQAQFAPLHQQHDRIQAEAEERGFVQKYPDWQKYVQASDLAEMKRQAPHMPLESLFKILAFDKATVDAGKTARSDELKKLVGRVPPASVPRAAPETRSKVVDLDSAWEAALQVVAAGRRNR